MYYKPVFIPVSSALDVESGGSIAWNSCNSGSSSPGYSSVTAGSVWTDWTSNSANWPHCTVSDYLACTVDNWMRETFLAGTNILYEPESCPDRYWGTNILPIMPPCSQL